MGFFISVSLGKQTKLELYNGVDGISKENHSYDKLSSYGSIRIMLQGKITGTFFKENIKKSKRDQEKFISSQYLARGPGFIRDIDGYFLILLQDLNSGIIYVFNNRYSHTYCYYTILSNKIFLSDDVVKLLNKGLIMPKPNSESINLFLNSGYSYSEKTCFSGIDRMIPGFYMSISKSKITHTRYSGMNFNRIKVSDIEMKIDTYEKLWKEAIGDFTKINETKSLGSALSGGLDTSWVALMASKVFKKPIKTYTCVYDYELFNEDKAAKYVTEKCHGIHTNVHVTEKDLDLLPEIIRAAQEPVLASSLSIYKMMKHASRETDTFLSGDGGNNIYHHLFPVGELHKYLRYMPYLLRKSLYEISRGVAILTGNERVWELMYALHPFSFSNMYGDFYKNLTCYRHFSQEERRLLLKSQHYAEPVQKKILGNIEIRKDNFDDALINSRFVYGNMQYVSAFQEKFAKSLGMKIFLPYENQKIMDFICSLPYDFLFRGNSIQKLINKANKMYFQKLSLSRYLPRSYVYKAGQPFDQPFHGWLEKRPRVTELLFKRLKKRGWYNVSYLKRLQNEHRNQHQHKNIFCQLSNHGYRIMALLSIEIWCTEFLDGRYRSENKKIPIEEYLAKYAVK